METTEQSNLKTSLKKTPLNSWHHNNGGKMVTYAGWDMPVQYEKGLSAEHLFTRTKASLFDVSHMGEFRFKGLEALKAVDYLVPTDISKLKEGESCYSFLPNSNGGVVDDLLVYCFSKENDYLICVNASNTDKVGQHLLQYKDDFKVEITNESDHWGQIAVQGPEARALTEKVISGVTKLTRFSFKDFDFQGEKIWVARTGYTGEDGFEIFIPNDKAEELWVALLNEGAEPCGLGARDSLRLEASLNLYGNELSDECNPFERRMGWTVDFSKGDFLAKGKLEGLKKSASRRLVGIKVLDRAIARAGYEVFADGQPVGQVTSGTMSPTLEAPIAMVWIDKEAARGEKQLKVQIRKKQAEAEIVSLPFLKNN